MATLLDTIGEAFLLATRKSTLPDAGSSKRNSLVALAKLYYKKWQTEKGTDWDSLYDVVSAGTVSATNTFDLATEILKVSTKNEDKVRILCTNGNYVDFKLIPASSLYAHKYDNCVAKVGQTVRFSRTFTTTDTEYGGTIEVPAYIKLDDLVSETDDVLIDDPTWLSTIVAAQFVLSDAQLEYQYGDLLGQANDLMEAMKLANSPNETTSTDTDYFSNGLGIE